MHDYLLSLTYDHIDGNIKDDITDFIVKTHGRENYISTIITTINSFLTKDQGASLERTEHEFSPEKITILTQDRNSKAPRLPSARSFKKCKPLNRATFETLIMNSFRGRMAEHRITYPYPSGGALYTGQVIVYIKNVEGYEEGAYHYLPISNQFEKLQSLSYSLVKKALFTRDEKNLSEFDFFILYGSLIDKHICKYGYRGYRLAVLEIGSMYTNVELECQSLYLKNIVWGGFWDEALTVSLGLDPRVVVPMICQIVGR
ncbi:SagB/ThcOx family dehydrogenase [Pectobacterium cacticida]|uniref:SagB/ThcOx family dehydrogenase n=1 Tax=Pectobacterium cacticida TaxID=69221 RepID=UPI002FF439E4